MKVITEQNLLDHLAENLNRDSITKRYQKALLEGLKLFHDDPKISPPRTVQTSCTEGSDTTHLFMPCVAPNSVGIKVISGGPSNNQKGIGFQGCILVLNEYTGQLECVLNAKSITAFRTAIASSLALVNVFNPYCEEAIGSVSVFGTGAQAYWHVKIALALYEGRIKKINIVNRSLANARTFADTLRKEFSDVIVESFLYCEEYMLPSIEKVVRQSTIIFGCSPSTSPVIMNKYIDDNPQKKKFISLIGSYKPHMIELDLTFIDKFYRQDPKKPKIIVDLIPHTLEEAGELIQSEMGPSDLIELSALYEQNSGVENVTTSSNVVVSKIVGLSIMDLSIAKALMVEISDKNATLIQDF